MVRVLVCRNDGAFEYQAADVQHLDAWNDVKMDLARALYTEEELFTVVSPSDIALYKLPEGDDVEILAPSVEAASLVVMNSKWVLDIFCSPFRRSMDLAIQTDSAIRGIRRNSLDTLIGRRGTVRTSSNGTPYSPLGNVSVTSTSFTAATPQTVALHEPYIHIGTWVPMVVTDKVRPTGGLLNVLKPLTTAEYEDVLLTTTRAREYIKRFRRIGRPVTILSLQTVTLPLAVACPSAISQHGARSLYDGVFHLSEGDLQRGFVQAVRLWFSFDCEQTVSVTKVNGTLGVKPLRQQDGWIVVQALPGSPAFEAGMRGDEVFLTHVNGVDVSPHAFPSVCDRYASQISWKDSVIPLVEKTETCIFTFF